MRISDYQVHNHPEYNKMRMLATVGLTVGFTLFFNIMFNKNPEIRKLRRAGINYAISPEVGDFDGNGVDDFAFHTLGGDRVPLYGHRDGSYSFKQEGGE